MKAELLKHKRTIWILAVLCIPVGINALLTFDLHFRYPGFLVPNQSVMMLTDWQLIFKEQTIFYFSELTPFVAALTTYELFAVEIKHNANSLMLSMPSARYIQISRKFVLALMVMVLYTFINNLTLILAGCITGVEAPLEVALFGKAIAIDIAAAAASIALSFFLIQVFRRRPVMILPVMLIFGLVFGFSYYSDPSSPFVTFNPLTLASYCFRADSVVVFRVMIISFVTVVFALFATMFVVDKSDNPLV